MMPGRNPFDPPPCPGSITDDQWTKILTAAVDSPNGETWTRNALANAENATNN